MPIAPGIDQRFIAQRMQIGIPPNITQFPVQQSQPDFGATLGIPNQQPNVMPADPTTGVVDPRGMSITTPTYDSRGMPMPPTPQIQGVLPESPVDRVRRLMLAMPMGADHKPSVLRRIGGGLIAAGIGGKEGRETGANFTNDPYNSAFSEWQKQFGAAGKEAELENTFQKTANAGVGDTAQLIRALDAGDVKKQGDIAGAKAAAEQAYKRDLQELKGSQSMKRLITNWDNKDKAAKERQTFERVLATDKNDTAINISDKHLTETVREFNARLRIQKDTLTLRQQLSKIAELRANTNEAIANQAAIAFAEKDLQTKEYQYLFSQQRNPRSQVLERTTMKSPQTIAKELGISVPEAQLRISRFYAARDTAAKLYSISADALKQTSPEFNPLGGYDATN